MTCIGRRILPIVLALTSASAGSVAAQQGFFFTAGRVLVSPEESSWRATVERDIIGPIGADASFIAYPGGRPETGRLYGLGTDLTLFSADRGVPTIFAGASAGIGTGGQKKLWASASLGARMAIISVGPFR